MYLISITRNPIIRIGKFCIRLKEKTIRIPDKWVDVRADQLLRFLAYQIILSQTTNVNAIQQKLVMYCINYKWLKHFNMKQLRDHVCPNFEFISKSVNHNVKPYFTFRKRLKGKKLPFKLKLYLPKPLLADVTGQEFAMAIKQLVIYHNKKGEDESKLNKFLAIVCRPKISKLSNFFTKDFTRKEIGDVDGRLQYVATLHPLYKQYVHQYFLAQLDALKTVPKFKIMFPDPSEEMEDDGIGESLFNTKQDPNQWVDFLITVAESGILGTLQEVEKENFQTILYTAAKKQHDFLEQQRKADLNANKHS